MTTARHPKGTPTGGRFAPSQHAEAHVVLDYVPITNEDDTWLPFCDDCGAQSDQIVETNTGSSLCPYCFDSYKLNNQGDSEHHDDFEGPEEEVA